MTDNLFNRLNRQRIPDEARALLLEGHFDIAGNEIRIGDFTFPYDIFHVMEAVNVLEGRLHEQSKLIKAQRIDKADLIKKVRGLGLPESEVNRFIEDIEGDES